MFDVDALVLGAGLSGLVAAHALRSAGRRVLVLERHHAPVGRAFTERFDGFLMEHGATSIAGPAPVAEGLIERLGLGLERVDRGPRVRRRYLVRNGAVRSLPIHPLHFFLSGFLSVSGRLRMMAEPFIPAGPDDESVAEFVRRRFGREFLDYVVDPLVGGLHSGNPDRLSIAALFPRLKGLEREQGSVALGLLKTRLRRGGKSMPGRSLFSFRDGMGTLPRAIAHSLGNTLLLNVRADSVAPAAGGGYAVRVEQAGGRKTLRASAVIVALPAYGAASVLSGVEPELAAVLAGIDHPPIAVVFLGYRADDIAHPLDGLGFLTPRLEGRPALGMLFSSTLFAGRAPDGHVALTAFVGGARQPDMARRPPDELVAAMTAEAGALLGAKAAPVVARTRYWMRGLPQYTMGHPTRVAAMRSAEDSRPGLFITGNYLQGVSTAACIEQALVTASRVESFLQRRDAAFFPKARAAGCPA